MRDLNQHTSEVVREVADKHSSVTVTSDGQPVARIVPIDREQRVLDQQVASGRATAPTATGPIPVPPARGDVNMDVASWLAEDREQERW